jgi:DNA polymerase III epsilon subunit-like protein
MWFFHEHRDEPPPADFKLATLCHHFGVTFHAASAHEALADVSATVSLYRALVQKGDKPLAYPKQSSDAVISDPAVSAEAACIAQAGHGQERFPRSAG